MGIKTNIEWCDSSLNLMMGCSHGCELWNPKTGVAACYAGQLTNRWAGKNGWPASFENPAIFLERLGPALAWPDLTGLSRPDKPWLNGLPRLIFLNDIGDTFTEGLPLDWLFPVIEQMSESPHRFLILTKRPRRMYKAFKEYGRIPRNFWLMTSATDQATWDARVPELIKCRDINSQITLGVSCEPLLGPIDMRSDWGIGMVRCHECGKRSWLNVEATECPWCGQASAHDADTINWIIAGGESGRTARPCHPDWVRRLRAECVGTNTAFFWKQWGEWGPKPPEWLVKANNVVVKLHPASPDWQDTRMFNVGKKDAGRLLDGAEWSQMPEQPEVAF